MEAQREGDRGLSMPVVEVVTWYSEEKQDELPSGAWTSCINYSSTASLFTYTCTYVVTSQLVSVSRASLQAAELGHCLLLQGEVYFH